MFQIEHVFPRIRLRVMHTLIMAEIVQVVITHQVKVALQSQLKVVLPFLIPSAVVPADITNPATVVFQISETPFKTIIL